MPASSWKLPRWSKRILSMRNSHQQEPTTMATRRSERTTNSPRKAFSKSPGRRSRVLSPRTSTRATAVSPGRAKSPLISLPPPTPSSVETASCDDWSQYSGDQQSEVDCLQKLKEYCKLFQIPASDSLIFRFACFYDFDYEETRKAFKKDYNNPYLRSFEMDDTMVKQFQTAILFPIPKLRTKKRKSQLIYVRPCRYDTVRSTSPDEAFDELLKQLCFVLNDLSRTAQQCRHGISLLINLKGFSRRNVDIKNSTRLVQMIQSHMVPTKIEMVLFVNTTTMSSKIWQTSIRPLLSPEEQKKVFFAKQDELYSYLMPSFEKLLPDEIAEGWKNTTDLIDTYVDRKIRIEKEQQQQQQQEQDQ